VRSIAKRRTSHVDLHSGIGSADHRGIVYGLSVFSVMLLT
jgi:hypothetical protein